MVATNVLKRVVTASVMTATVAVSPVFALVSQAQTLNGAGATFPLTLYQRYAAELKKQGIQMNYQGVGSGAGIRQVIAGTVDFGGTDAPPKAEERQRTPKGGMLTIPTAGGGVSVVYNLPGNPSLKLSRKTLPAIFSGQISKWNDPKIAADNPGVNLPNTEIKVAVRADSSGTTNIFTSHLSAIDPYFRGRIGKGSAPKWIKASLKGKGNPGVAAIVKKTGGSIGYVEDSFVAKTGLKAAAIQNRAGQYVESGAASNAQALGGVKFDSNFIGDASDPSQGYPIVGLTYLMLYKQYPDATKSAGVKKMVEWILTKGQDFNKQLGFTEIPDSVAQQAISAVKSQVKP